MDSFEIGSLKARLVTAPPVYAPGGPVCFLSDFPTTGGDWQAVAGEARRRGAVLLIIPQPEGSPAVADLLGGGFTFASRWYAGPTGGDAPPAPAMRPATAADVPRILEIGAIKRRLYETFSPVFWKVAPTPHSEFAPFITMQVEKPENIALVFEQAGEITGYCIVQKDYVDDFTVAVQTDWPNAGVALLTEAKRLAHLGGVEAFSIVCGYADEPKRAAIETCGFTAQQNWLVLPL